ncbi:MAG: thioesterase family protein [Granulosicoccus sp.]|nr:thioesterase family protein [Granulosicoccus sp.]
MAKCFFTADGSGWFTPTEHTRGPWHPDHCHAGPPTGLLARSMEKLLNTETGITRDQNGFQRLTRMTVTLHRPIPMDAVRVDAKIRRQGRSVSLLEAHLSDRAGKTCAVAEGLHMLVREPHDYPTQSRQFGAVADAKPGSFPIKSGTHSLPAFNHGVETRYPDGQDGQPGPTTLWLKTVPLLADETPSPFQRICPLADCGNAFSRNAEPDAITFVNPDLTLVLHRDPVGEWLGSQSAGYWEPSGIGMADALLFDELGVAGRAVQTLLLSPVNT